MIGELSHGHDRTEGTATQRTVHDSEDRTVQPRQESQGTANKAVDETTAAAGNTRQNDRTRTFRASHTGT